MVELYESSYVEHLGRVVENSLIQWGFSSQSAVSLLTVSENATFQVTVPDGVKYVVRVHRPHYHTLAEIKSELLWIESLRSKQVVTTPRPITLTNGDRIAAFREGSDIRYMVAFEFMPGKEPSASDELVAGFRQLGSINAKLHQHVVNWNTSKEFVRKTWNFDTTIGRAPHWGRWEDCPDLTESDKVVLSEVVDVIKTRLAGFGTGTERFGLIHADLRLANLLVDDNSLAVIDFDDCGFGWYVYDFAAAISFIEEDPQIPDLLQAWVSGYREVSELTHEDETMIPTFIMLRRLMLTAWLNTHSETPTAKELGVGFLQGTLRMAHRMLGDGSPVALSDKTPVS